VEEFAAAAGLRGGMGALDGDADDEKSSGQAVPPTSSRRTTSVGPMANFLTKLRALLPRAWGFTGCR
jgi:hypothetical protein